MTLKRVGLGLIILLLSLVVSGAAFVAITAQPHSAPVTAVAAARPLYVVIMTHVEGDVGEPEWSTTCPTSVAYQTLPPPPPGEPPPGPTFAVDILGTELLREILQNYTDSYGSEPKLFIEPTGEFWQTEADPTYGGKLFSKYDYQALGYEFGIQGHAIYYSGQNFCWYNSPHTAEGVQRKLTDLHNAAQTVVRNGQPVNDGLTYTGGWKLEKDALGDANAESIIDHAAASLGYRISFEDHDGHIEDEPPGINNSRASYYVYRADYGDGVQTIKIDFNGGVNASCQGNTPRCETPQEAIARFDATVAAKNADSDPSHVYFFAFTVHSEAVWADFHMAAGGQPMVGEGAGLLALMDAIEARKGAGAEIKYVTPSELAAIFEAANPTPTTHTIEAIDTWATAPNGNRLYTRIVQPVPALYPGQRFPALIAIPGGTGPGAPLADNPAYRELAASGFVVVAFNPEGRGTGLPGNLRSQGSEDCNGFIHQDDLKAVVEFVARRPNVDAGNVGVQTSSFGIAIGAGALGRYPSLPVAYLVDAEGPHDNRVITFYDVGREVQVCGHWSTVTDPSPENQAFWAEREAVRYIGSYPGRYLRMQAEIDHAQNPGYFRHAIEMVNGATRPEFGGTGSALWTRMNGSDLGNPINTVYPLNDPSQYPAWVPGRLSDHLGLEITYIREMAVLSTCADSDGDGLTDCHEAWLGTDPLTPDTDADGCADGEEVWLGLNPATWHDFYDVPVPAYPDPGPNGGKNQAVSIADVLAVLFYVGTFDGGPPNVNGVDYDSTKNGDRNGDTVVIEADDQVGLDYDRSPGSPPNPPWDAGPPDGAINMQDVLAALAQVGLSCAGPP